MPAETEQHEDFYALLHLTWTVPWYVAELAMEARDITTTDESILIVPPYQHSRTVETP